MGSSDLVENILFFLPLIQGNTFIARKIHES